MVKSELTSSTNESQTRDMGRVYKRKSHLTGLTFLILEPGASREDNWVTDVFSVSKSNALKEVLSL